MIDGSGKREKESEKNYDCVARVEISRNKDAIIRRDFKTYKCNKFTKKKIATFTMWYSNDMFHHMLKAEFVTLVSLKVPSGSSTVELGPLIRARL